ncbi:MAG TPA: Hpt domain-containing protein [Ferrovibrio sp.]|jgi:chemotaxis protein histidine kinase CheA|uniref:Hpt domain-containing protein n=1 Tax=Ferrovibrio sp. TaxID=1917215 RepID=UPI002ED5C5D9
MTGQDNDGDQTDQRSFDAVVASAEAAVASLADQYVGWVNDDLHRLDTAVAAVTDGRVEGESGKQVLTAVYDVAHDIKGQGSTFGYDLVTEIAHLLCSYVTKAIQKQRVDRAVIDAHITALRTVVDNRIRGSAGELGREIVDTLRNAAAKSLG